MPPADAYRDLLTNLRETRVLSSCARILGWDQETHMPTQGAELRAQQLAMLSGMVHRRKTSDEVRALLDDARPFGEAQGEDSAEAANLREAQRDFDRSTKIPVELVEERARTRTLARRSWVEARKNDDYEQFRPWLEKTVELSLRYAEALGYDDHPYDALLDEYEPGETTANLKAVFGPLGTALSDLAGRIFNGGAPVDASCLGRDFPVPAQRDFARAVCTAVGFDFDAGRMDDTTHPFCTGIGPGDVRLTARWNERMFADGFFSMLHEAGHGIYEQGLTDEHFGSPLGDSCSLGIHESQSRLWENLVGRSRGFWRYWLPHAQKAFPALDGVDLEEMYRAVNEVTPGFIRVDADEVTYNLHIFLRFQVEQDLLTGDLAAKDLPEVWNERFAGILGRTPSTNAEGCLQDVHWSAGLFGYFPTYTLGNVYGAMIYDRAEEELGDLDDAFGRGEFEPLRQWLTEKIHQHGRRYAPRDLVERVTGRAPDAAALLSRLETKYGAIHAL